MTAASHLKPADMLQVVRYKRPQLIYLSGKTATGKSTFANTLEQELDYRVIELDKLMEQTVIHPLHLADNELGYIEVYRKRGKMEWIQRFVAAGQELMKADNRPTVVEGSIAHPLTLQEFFAGSPDFMFVYFHPANISTYKRYITNRFLTATATYNANLPKTLWDQVDKDAFQQFCKDRVLTPNLRKAIDHYAATSQQESKERLDKFQKYFKGIRIIEI